MAVAAVGPRGCGTAAVRSLTRQRGVGPPPTSGWRTAGTGGSRWRPETSVFFLGSG